jgi:hypothetical protein
MLASEDSQSGLTDMEKQILKSTMDDMVTSTAMITTKIAGAIGVDIYDLRMGNGTLIRMYARQVVLGVHGLSMFGYDVAEYFEVLRNDIEDLRSLFFEWWRPSTLGIMSMIAGGLFNPPVVAVSDQGDSLPFNYREYFNNEELQNPPGSEDHDILKFICGNNSGKRSMIETNLGTH